MKQGEVPVPGELVLASTSKYRRELLERLGLPFRCRAPLLDEEQEKRRHTALLPASLAEALAKAKAQSIMAQEPGATVIGSDQLLVLSGEILGKPGSVEGALAQLTRMSGQSMELITALSVCGPRSQFAHLDIARLTMRRLSEPELSRYIQADRPLDCAGAFKLEARGIALFERIECDDHSAITGLPLVALVTILRELGYPIP